MTRKGLGGQDPLIHGRENTRQRVFRGIPRLQCDRLEYKHIFVIVGEWKRRVYEQD